MGKQRARAWIAAAAVFALVAVASVGSVFANTGDMADVGNIPSVQLEQADEAQPAATQEAPAPAPAESIQPDEPTQEPTLSADPSQPTQGPAPTATAEPQPEPAPDPIPAPSSVPTENVTPAPEGSKAPASAPAYDQPAVFLSGIAALGSDEDLKLTDKQKQELDGCIGADGTHALRRKIVQKAYSLKGKLSYFWGGKSAVIGWDNRWKNDAIVGSTGSAQTGTTRPYGMDCSGYTLWVMINAFQRTDNDFINSVGWSTAEQWNNSQEIEWKDAQPGDLVFYGAPTDTGINHVGVVLGRDAQGYVVAAHESSSQNNVVVSRARDAGFRHARCLKVVAKATVPVEISTWEQFKNLGNTDYDPSYTMDADYVLTASIASDGGAFTPIGTEESPFLGRFDGNGFVIDVSANPEIDTAAGYGGLFGVVRQDSGQE